LLSTTSSSFFCFLGVILLATGDEEEDEEDEEDEDEEDGEL
jgi:hypothetical protein